MNDSDLNELLRRARVPERSEHAWKELAGDTVRGLNLRRDQVDGLALRGHALAARAHLPGKRIALWSAVFATACVLIALALNHWRADRTEPNNDLAAAQKLFSELNALFPDQLEAVVFDGSTPRLVLAEQTSQHKGTPIFVRLCGAQGCQRVITFSGQRVSLNGESCEVLLDARGHVIVTGERFVWSSGDEPSAQGGYRIEAAMLAGAL